MCSLGYIQLCKSGLYFCLCREARVESFSRFVKGMDDSVKNLCIVGERSAKKHEDGKFFEFLNSI